MMTTIRTGGIALLVAGVLAACSVAPSSTPPSNGPSASAVASSSPTTVPPSPTVVLSASPTASPTACGVQADEGRLPSDRLVDVRISQEPGVDVVTFVFGDPSSAAPPQGASSGSIEAVEPPFSAAGSGEPIEVPGEHHVAVRFTGMTLYDDTGAATYDGPTSFGEAGPALRSMVQDDAFEGVSGWIIGYDGPGCVTLASGPGSVSVVIQHGPG